MVKAIVFDIGGVIQTTDWSDSAEHIGMTTEEYKLYILKDRENHFNLLQTGKITDEVFAEWVLGEMGWDITDENIKLFIESLVIFNAPDLRMIELIKKIDPNITKAILSNNWPSLEADTHRFDGTEFEYFSLFEPNIYMSHGIGHRKPNKEAFLTVVENLGVKPSEMMFIDDQEGNILAAEKHGIKTFMYDNEMFDVFEKYMEKYMS